MGEHLVRRGDVQQREHLVRRGGVSRQTVSFERPSRWQNVTFRWDDNPDQCRGAYIHRSGRRLSHPTHEIDR